MSDRTLMRAAAVLIVALAASAVAEPAQGPPPGGRALVMVVPHGFAARPRTTLVFRPGSTPPAAAHGSRAVEVRTDAIDDKPVEVMLPAGHWTLDVEGPVWHTAQSLAVLPDAATSVAVDVWPKATISGRVEASLEPSPTELLIRFESVDGPQRESIGGDVDCPVVASVFTCGLPAGKFNLRIRPRGSIAEYRNNSTLKEGGVVDLGRFIFRRGQSITGRLRMPADFSGKIADVAVTATPSMGVNADSISGGRLLTVPGKVEGNGFFHVDGVAPGVYAIQAQYRQVLFSETLLVDVRPEKEAELIQSLSLLPPGRITVTMSPPTTPAAERWHVRLSKQMPGEALEPLTESSASPDGTWISPMLQPAQYWLTIGTMRGDVWHTEEVELGPVDLNIPVLLASTTLEGNVRFGDEPLPASLLFLTAEGMQIHAESDGEGRYRVVLPSLDRNSSLNVHVESESPRIERTVTLPLPHHHRSADVILPRSILQGSVVDTEGAPVPEAILYISGRDTREALIEAQTSADGTFVTYGLADGTYVVMASSFLRESEPQRIEIRKDLTSDPVRLVVRPMSTVRGRVLSPHGPVPGATVQARAVDVDQGIVANRPTDLNGDFVIAVAPGARAVDLSVSAPGFSHVLAGVAVTARPIMVNVDQRGGTIKVRAKAGDVPYLVHHSGTEPVTAMEGTWPVATQDIGDGVREFVLPMMEPGLYDACIVRTPDIPRFRRSNGRDGGRCVSGALAPFGTLTVDLRLPQPAPPGPNEPRYPVIH